MVSAVLRVLAALGLAACQWEPKTPLPPDPERPCARLAYVFFPVAETLAGNGTNSDGEAEAWRAVVPR